MRQFRLPILLSVASLALTACVAVTPMPGTNPTPVTPAPTPVTPAPTPTTLDAASRAAARAAISAELSTRLPAKLVGAGTDCVVNNATTAELIDIAQMSTAGVRGVADSVLAIVKRPATTACIAAAGQAAS